MTETITVDLPVNRETVLFLARLAGASITNGVAKPARKPAAKKAPKKAGKRKAPPRVDSTPRKASGSAYDELVLTAIADANGIGSGDLRAVCGGSRVQIRTATARLEKAGLITHAGKARGMLYYAAQNDDAGYSSTPDDEAAQ